MKKQITFEAKVWIYPGETSAWHFVSVPKTLSADIKKKHGPTAKGWGSLPVSVMIGSTTWKTSLFPDSKSGMYFLPLKAEVRKKEALYEGDVLKVALTLR